MSKKKLYDEACSERLNLKITPKQLVKLEKMKKDFGLFSHSDVVRFIIDTFTKELPKSADRREEPVSSPPEKKAERSEE